jgi:hypothetical protein
MTGNLRFYYHLTSDGWSEEADRDMRKHFSMFPFRILPPRFRRASTRHVSRPTSR